MLRHLTRYLINHKNKEFFLKKKILRAMNLNEEWKCLSPFYICRVSIKFLPMLCSAIMVGRHHALNQLLDRRNDRPFNTS